jgi:hypothetical protein
VRRSEKMTGIGRGKSQRSDPRLELRGASWIGGRRRKVESNSRWRVEHSLDLSSPDHLTAACRLLA